MYAFDPTGASIQNKINSEVQVITAANSKPYHIVIPKASPFFRDGFIVSFKDSTNIVRSLKEGVDFNFVYRFEGASLACRKDIYGGIELINKNMAGAVTLTYNTIGDKWVVDSSKINEILSDTYYNPAIAYWEEITSLPEVFPAIPHEWHLDDMVGMKEVVDTLDTIAENILKAPVDTTPVPRQLFPTPKQVGLGKVKNFGIATETEAKAGTTKQAYMTPYLTRYMLDNVLPTYINNAIDKYTSASMPTTGVWKRGEFVKNNSPVILTHTSGPLKDLKYYVSGWMRITNSNTNIENVDWFVSKVLV